MGWYPAAFIRSKFIRSWAACLSMRWTASPLLHDQVGLQNLSPPAARGPPLPGRGAEPERLRPRPEGPGGTFSFSWGAGACWGTEGVRWGVSGRGTAAGRGFFNIFHRFIHISAKSGGFPGGFWGKNRGQIPPCKGDAGCTPVPTAAAEPRRRPEGPACPAPAGGADAVLRRNRPAETAGGGAKVTVGWRVSPWRAESTP